MDNLDDPALFVKLRNPPFADRDCELKIANNSPFARFRRTHLGNGKYGLRQYGIDEDRARANGHKELPREQQQAKLPRFSDPGKEAAIAGCIAEGTFDAIRPEALCPAAAFGDPCWRIIYAAARALRNGATTVCAESVNDYIAFHGLDEELQRAFDPTRTASWQLWPQRAEDRSLAYAPRGAAYCLKELGELYAKRETARIATELAEGALELEDAMAKFEAILHGRNGADGNLPPMISAIELNANPPPTPPELIAGILHRGTKFAFGGGSKSFKTWALLQMAISIAEGSPWLDRFNTTRSPVLYVNFELPGFAIEKRQCLICEALGIPIPQNLTFWNLRGYAADAAVILPKIGAASRNQGFAAIFLDPIYKLLGGRDENSAKDMTDLMNRIERLSEDTAAAVLYGSHFAKGNAAGKEAIDRISGSGVTARDPDTIATLTPHEEDDCFSLEFKLRNFAPQDSFVIRREHPLLIIQPGLDPADLKGGKAGRKAEFAPAAVLAQLDAPLTNKAWKDKCHDALGMAATTFNRYRDKLNEEGKVFYSSLDDLWAKKPK